MSDNLNFKAKMLYISAILVAIAAIILMVYSAKINATSHNSTTSSKPNENQVVRKCEECGAKANKSLTGTIFPDNKVHYFCTPCFNDLVG